jgi:hypothetical protein
MAPAEQGDQLKKGSLGQRMHQAVVLFARVQLDPPATNRARLPSFLNLITAHLQDDG